VSLEHSLVRSGERYAFKISEFCETHRISRALFYKLKRAGDAPALTPENLITVEAAAEWRRKRTGMPMPADKVAERAARAARAARGEMSSAAL
jgi:hypothetical protein